MRAKNAEVRRKQREIERLEVEETKRANTQRIEHQYEALLHKQGEQGVPPDPPENDEVEEEVVYERRKPRKRKVVIVEDSEEEEIEVKLPKRKSKHAADAEDAIYQRSYAKMFGID